MNELKSRILDKNLEFFGVSIEQLMENAGKKFAEEFEKKFGSGKRIGIFCGTGNNGGDGFVAARYLSEKNNVTVFLVGKPKEIRTNEAKKNWKRLPKKVKKKFYTEKTKVESMKFDIVVDALLGAGVKGGLREPINSLVKKLNKLKAKKSAIDVSTKGFKSNFTVSFLYKKEKNAKLVDIGYPKEIEFYAGPGHVKFLKEKKRTSHKGENGIVLVVAGSKQYHGASIFASLTASRIVDLVFVCTSKENIPFVKRASPEFIVSDLSEAKKLAKKADSILIGPGLEKNHRVSKLVNELISKNEEKKIVLDATALRLLNKKKLHKNCVLTPHKNEFESLFKERALKENVKRMAKKFNCIILLKGPTDIISDGKNLYFNFSGNEGMTKGGTGDVLAGLIAGFAAKNELMQAVLSAAFLNGFAGDLLKRCVGTMFNATDLMNTLPFAMELCRKF